MVGTTWGGNGTTTFAVPDLRPAAPRGANGPGLTPIICTAGLYPPRN